MEPLVAVDKAQCRIGGQALLTVEHFAIERGQHWCVFGRNGSGKTLLANLISAKRRECSSYVSYATNFDPTLDLYTVSFEEQQRLWARDNRLDISEYSSNAQDKGTVVEELIRASRARQIQDDSLFARLIEQLALKGVLSKGIRFLSSGQMRKVLIARALYAYREGAVRLLILDDPLESIDRASQEQIRNTIGASMDEGFSSLQLCRRAQDILPGVSHMALMRQDASGMGIVRQGSLDEVMGSSEYVQIESARAQVPEKLSTLLPMNAGARDDDEELIRLENVTASYGNITVLTDVNWLMTSRDHVVIEGPNGCGKSTLLSLIDGENHKGYGQEVFLFSRLKGSGETIWETKKHFGVVSNELHNRYIKGWRVLDVVVSGFFDSVGLYDETGSAQIEEARSWIEALGLQQLETHYYHEISFGQQRLVLLARAMVKKPRILILDEPCVGLDDYHRQLILAVLDTIALRAHTNILYVTHVPDEQPHCINQVLRFSKHSAGGYTVEQLLQGSA
ncbi:MAG: ATP-binding cassette domain-containing protein [Gammaproteobacteria bacterium]|nr:ATP-binding cassette domain-containing protein [Gammaproteobacteria bacterium]MDG2336747.1 ATP-binding cassette domain-containing protein [Gammaproteobacteria bacterium]